MESTIEKKTEDLIEAEKMSALVEKELETSVEVQVGRNINRDGIQEKRCLKVTTYYFLPDEVNDRKDLRYFIGHPGFGMVILHDENNKRMEGVRVDSFGHGMDVVCK